MATRTVVETTDDVDGKRADETLTLGLDGVEYMIDLSVKNATKLRRAYAPWIAAARRVGGRKSQNIKSVPTGVDAAAVRAWAQSNGYEVSSRGRIAAEVIEAYRAAGN